jgi:uncharacterized protein YeaO (DUF488 family)
MPLKTRCVYEKPTDDEGHRVLVMRYWPRGVRRDAVDVWERDLGTQPDLIRAWKGGEVTWQEFAKRYRASVAPQKAKIAELAERTKKETVTLLCSCRDESRCHRIVLKELIAAAARQRRR